MRNRLRSLGTVNTMQPINWGHSLNFGRVAWWKILPNSGWSGGTMLRDLCKRNDGIIQGSSSPPQGNNVKWQGPSGLIGSGGSVLTDGSSGAVQTTFGLPTNATFSVAFWVKVLSAPGSYYPLVDCGSWGNGNGFGLFINPSSQPYFVVRDGFAGQDISIAGWARLVGTAFFDGGSYSALRLYVNGQLSGTAGTGSFMVSASSFTLGSRSTSGATAYVNAYFGDAAVWTRALTSQEVALDYALSQRGYPGVLNYLSPTAYSFASGIVSSSGLLLRRRRALV